jgi:RNA polymerase sigma-70 factor (ECF subfamily)
VSIARARREGEPAASNDTIVVPLQAIARADSAVIERLYAEHYRDVFRYILALTRSLEEAEEVTEDTFERALRTWRQVPERPVAWLLLTARRIATDRWRRGRRLARIPVARGGARPASSSAPDRDFNEWFEALASALTARQREVLVLRYQRDLTDADIGAVMDLSESGVRSLVARALATLRSHPELL